MASVSVFCDGVLFEQKALKGRIIDWEQERDQRWCTPTPSRYVASSAIASGRRAVQSLLEAALEARKAAAAIDFADVTPIPSDGFLAVIGFTGNCSSWKISESRTPPSNVRTHLSIIS
eukprot:GFKZ01012059.1.p2 GENE.GFKZ01012059.1~~GFKZ01012059.1.p2  ORF type:complete len:118 (-),score=14.22 GFKZ01012059.1:123-476(-)